MTAKMARSAPRPPFGVPGITAVVRAASLCCQKRRKSAKIHAGSGFIWRIPVYCFPELAKRAQAERPTRVDGQMGLPPSGRIWAPTGRPRVQWAYGRILLGVRRSSLFGAGI
jgi:hypothetical protein